MVDDQTNFNDSLQHNRGPDGVNWDPIPLADKKPNYAGSKNFAFDNRALEGPAPYDTTNPFPANMQGDRWVNGKRILDHYSISKPQDEAKLTYFLSGFENLKQTRKDGNIMYANENVSIVVAKESDNVHVAHTADPTTNAALKSCIVDFLKD